MTNPILRVKRRGRRWWVSPFLMAIGPAGCASRMSMLHPEGRAAVGLAHLSWFLIVFSTAVYIVVIGILITAILRNRRRPPTLDLQPVSTKFVTIGGIIVPAIILLTSLIVGFVMMRRYPPSAKGQPITYTVIGHQWWWDAEYQDPNPENRFRTANEIHVPVGRLVRLRLTSQDVIHSFWVPQLQGKLDLIPGRTNEIQLVADRPGVYRGQCAEYCGLQHAHMGIVIVADDSTNFAQWLATQRSPSVIPTDSLTSLGERFVTTGPCASCHTIRGTDMAGQVAPDLTHIGSRRTIAAAMLPNSLATLEAWIINAPALKPGTKMPAFPELPADEIQAMAQYLRTLQ